MSLHGAESVEEERWGCRHKSGTVDDGGWSAVKGNEAAAKIGSTSSTTTSDQSRYITFIHLLCSATFIHAFLLPVFRIHIYKTFLSFICLQTCPRNRSFSIEVKLESHLWRNTYRAHLAVSRIPEL